MGFREFDDQALQVSCLLYDLGYLDRDQDRVEPGPIRSPGHSVNHVPGMRCKPCDRNTPLGSGGPGRDRTIDTRIFSSSESRVRREKGEETERVFDGPTELPSPTEPIPNPAGRR